MANKGTKDTEPKKRGRPKGTGGNKRPDRSVQTDPGDNTKYIRHSLRVAGLGKCNLCDPVQVENRVIEYFQICEEDDMKPSLAGLALGLGTERGYLYDLRSGRRGNRPEVSAVLKRAVQILESQMNDYMQNGKINPVAGIFLSKNHFGYKDQSETIVVPKDPLGELQSADELKRKYIEGSLADEMALPDAQSDEES